MSRHVILGDGVVHMVFAVDFDTYRLLGSFHDFSRAAAYRDAQAATPERTPEGFHGSVETAPRSAAPRSAKKKVAKKAARRAAGDARKRVGGAGKKKQAAGVKAPRPGSLPARLVEAIAVFEKEGGDTPTTKDLAEATGADVGPVGQALKKLVAGNVIAVGAYKLARGALNGAHA